MGRRLPIRKNNRVENWEVILLVTGMVIQFSAIGFLFIIAG